MIDVSIRKNKSNPSTKDISGVISPVGYDKLKNAEFGELVNIHIRITEGMAQNYSNSFLLESQYEALTAKGIELSEIKSKFIEGEKLEDANRKCRVGAVIALEGKKVS